MSEETVFHQIVAKELPSEIVHEDERCMVIKDIHPAAPVHLLCLPKQYIRDMSAVKEEDAGILGHLLIVASLVAEKNGLASDGYRVVINCGDNGGMEVPYLHVHVMGGKKLPPLGETEG